MSNSNFGKQLRHFRRQCEDPKTGKPLTQKQIGDFLFDEMGGHYTGAAVSDWEHGKSKIDASHRLVLTSLIKILKRHGGIKTLADANLLLESGNYRPLNDSEKKEIFPEGVYQVSSSDPPQNFGFQDGVLFNFPVEL